MGRASKLAAFAARLTSDSKVPQDALAANVAGNGPAFSAYITTNQSVTANVWSKAQFSSEEFDTAGAFNNTGSAVGSAPAYSFNPQIAGYYQLEATLYIDGTSSASGGLVSIYKNGSEFKRSGVFGGVYGAGTASSVIYLNGSSDYIEVYGLAPSGWNSPRFTGGAVFSYFSGSLVRAA